MIKEINGKLKAICDKCGDKLPDNFETEYAAEYAISQEGWTTVSGDDYKDYCIKCKEENK